MAGAASKTSELTRLILSSLARNRPHSPLLQDSFRQLDSLAARDGRYRATTGFRRFFSTNIHADKNLEIQDKSDDSNPADAVKHIATSSLKISARHDLAMIFTCKVCETRSVKMASRESYENGVVVARCSGCNNLHLIADRLGWFGEPGSIEDFLAARGEEVKKGSADTLNLTLEDLAGKKVLED